MRKITTIAAAGLCAATFMAVAKADLPPKDALPAADIAEQLEKAGYTPIEISFDDGVWEVDVYQNEKPLELAVDPRSGKILYEHRDDAEPRPPKDAKALSTILHDLAKAGYTEIDEASFERRFWEIEGIHEGRKHELTVDPVKGDVLSDRLDD